MIPLKLYLLAAIAAALVGGGGWATWKWRDGEVARAEAKAEEAAQGARIWEKVAVDYKEDLNVTQEIARARGTELALARQREARFVESLARLAAQDKPSADWLGTPVPEPVRRLRRAEAGCAADPALQCPPSPPPADAPAPLPGPDREGPPSRGSGPPRSPSAVQPGQGIRPVLHTEEMQ